MKSKTDVCKGFYLEALAAEIMTTLGPIINEKVKDHVFTSAHERLNKILEREYVEYERQINDSPVRPLPFRRSS